MPAISFYDVGNPDKVATDGEVFGQFGVVKRAYGTYAVVHVLTGLRTGLGFDRQKTAIRLAKLLDQLNWSNVGPGKYGGSTDPDGIVAKSARYVIGVNRKETCEDTWKELEQFVQDNRKQ